MLKHTITRTHRQSSVVLPLIFAFAGSLAAQIIEPRIVSETLPSGSLMQIKMELTSPHPIVTGGARFEMDSSFSGFDGVSVFSPSGDAYGAALLRGQTFTANIVSPQASLGTQLDYPFLVVASRIKAGIAAGTQIPINFSPNFVLNAPGGTPYTYVVTNGILTIGGSISVDNVIPGGGVLAAGTTVRILGTGFTPTTQLAPGTLTISNFRYVSPTELNFEMGQTASITGQRLRVKNPANNNEVVYFSYLRATTIGASGRTLLNGVHPIFQEATSYTSAALTVPPAGGYPAGGGRVWRFCAGSRTATQLSASAGRLRIAVHGRGVFGERHGGTGNHAWILDALALGHCSAFGINAERI